MENLTGVPEVNKRKSDLIAAGLAIAASQGWRNLTSPRVAELAGCSTDMVNHYFGTVPKFRKAVLAEAVASKNHEVVADARKSPVKTEQRRTAPAERKAEVLRAATQVAETLGWHNLTRTHVAVAARCAESLINRYFGTVRGLREAVLLHAIETRNYPIILAGVAAGESTIPKDIKTEALNTLAE